MTLSEYPTTNGVLTRDGVWDATRLPHSGVAPRVRSGERDSCRWDRLAARRLFPGGNGGSTMGPITRRMATATAALAIVAGGVTASGALAGAASKPLAG